MKKLGIIMLSIVSLLTAACSKTLEVAANFPAYFSDQKINRNIEFGSQHDSKLDVYIPNDDKPTHPVIVFFYGGAWEYGKKRIYRFAADAFTSKGYVVVVPDYAKYPKYKFPVWQDEGARAVEWTYKNIAQYKGDPSQLFVMGHSAGAQIGALLSVDKSYGVREHIKAFAGLAGPYDFTPDEPQYVDMFSTSGENYKNIRVSNFIDGKQSPMLLLWGKDDETVGEINITHVKAALDKNGGEYKIIYYDGVGHIGIVASMTVLARGNAPVIEDVDAWFKSHLTVTPSHDGVQR